MEKKDYIQSVVKLVRTNKMSLYDYYYLLAKDVKTEKDYHLSDLEINNPFIGIQDYKLLLESSEEDICKYFALSMEKVLLLNMETMNLSKEGLTRGDIEEVISEEMKSDHLTRGDIEEVISEEMKSDHLTRGDIEEVISEEMKSDYLTRGDIEEVISEEMKTDDLTKSDIEEEVNEKNEKPSLIKNFFMNISKKISNVLNGFAVVHNKENSSADIYYYNAEDESFSSKKTFNNINADDGIYINYQEYLDRLFDSIYDRYEDIQAILFQDEDGKDMSFYHFASKMYETLHEAKSLRFGEELEQNKPKTYQELIDLKLEGEANFQDHMLKKGVYVRRDLVDEIIAKYKVKVITSNHEFYEENQNVK